ncbi:hypothetical protein XENTR_v10000198 [Xenopus tropicalis]|nr:hypothetical protein XENTR_v10000198 [Xenopus tropicalis]
MAAADLRDEQSCSICLNIYTDPVMLPCGHNYCRGCIGGLLDTQEGSGGYSCPECRAEFQQRPALQRNRTLGNIAERFLPAQSEQQGAPGIYCTYCIQSPVAATKSCLHCEASLCDNHVRVHSKSAEHILCQPSDSLPNRKCSAHKRLLEYYCMEDNACICVSCHIVGHHIGHKVALLSEASERKKGKLRNALERLILKRERAERDSQRLQERRREMEEKAANETERVTALFRGIREQLEALEERVLSEISRQRDSLLLCFSDLIQQLEMNKEELSREIHDTEELCNMADPLTVLQGAELDGDAFCDAWEAETEGRGSGDKGVHWCSKFADHFPTCERFQDYPQALSIQSFSSGRHYWDVKWVKVVVTGSTGYCIIGVAYPSMQRYGQESYIGRNKKSVGLFLWDDRYSVIHDGQRKNLPYISTCNKIRVSLDYDGGRLSFYELSEPIRHLHTVTATFTEPLHAAFWVWKSSLTINK